MKAPMGTAKRVRRQGNNTTGNSSVKVILYSSCDTLTYYLSLKNNPGSCSGVKDRSFT
jgi:hypothetical protein